jgi:hypothetical protein
LHTPWHVLDDRETFGHTGAPFDQVLVKGFSIYAPPPSPHEPTHLSRNRSNMTEHVALRSVDRTSHKPDVHPSGNVDSTAVSLVDPP